MVKINNHKNVLRGMRLMDVIAGSHPAAVAAGDDDVIKQ